MDLTGLRVIRAALGAVPEFYLLADKDSWEISALNRAPHSAHDNVVLEKGSCVGYL